MTSDREKRRAERLLDKKFRTPHDGANEPEVELDADQSLIRHVLDRDYLSNISRMAKDLGMTSQNLRLYVVDGTSHPRLSLLEDVARLVDLSVEDLRRETAGEAVGISEGIYLTRAGSKITAGDLTAEERLQLIRELSQPYGDDSKD